jgi:hypothetical protein
VLIVILISMLLGFAHIQDGESTAAAVFHCVPSTKFVHIHLVVVGVMLGLAARSLFWSSQFCS